MNRYEELDALRSFLKKERCLLSFYINTLNDKGLNFPDPLLKHSKNVYLIKRQFLWADTIEGHVYWERVYKLWKTRLKNGEV